MPAENQTTVVFQEHTGGMTEIVLLAIFIGGLSNMMAEQGGLNYLMKRIRKLVKGRKSAEIGIAVLVSAADVVVAPVNMHGL